MSTVPRPTPKAPAPAGWNLRRKRVLIAGVCLLVVAGVVTAVLAYGYATRDPNEGVQFFTVARGPIVIDVTLAGAIQNRDQVVIKNEVEGKTTILAIAPEGNYVQAGDLLVELDSSQMNEQRKQQEITVINAEAAYVAARENLAITENQGASDVKKAELDLLFAQMDLKKYQEGDYKQQLQQAGADVTLARERLKRATEQVAWSRRLKEEGYVTATELQADELAAEKARLDQEMADVKLWLLQEYTSRRSVEEYKSKVEQAELALDRVQRKAAADIIQAKADLAAKESELAQQKERLAKLQVQIEKCTIRAPVDGLVVYATTGKMSHGHGRGGDQPPLAEGVTVVERQELIYLPTTASMAALVMVHEASLRKVRPGLPVRLTVDAAPGKVYTGRVEKIGLLPDAQSQMMNPGLKVYATLIQLTEERSELRAGMGCLAELIIQEHPQAVYVPLPAVVRAGERHLAYVLTPAGPRAREVEVGLDNNEVIHVLRGLSAGERIMRSPPLAESVAPQDAAGPARPPAQSGGA